MRRRFSNAPHHQTSAVPRRSAVKGTSPLSPPCYWTLTFSKGLGSLVIEELAERGIRIASQLINDEEISFSGVQALGNKLITIRTASALFRGIILPIDRPRGITSYEYRQAMRLLFEDVSRITPLTTFQSIRLEGAGKETATFKKLGAFFEELTSCPYRPDDPDADLVVRIRRPLREQGWEILVRATRRPLATRPWRESNFRGAISGPLAAAMVRLGRPSRRDVVLNLPCGSGTILGELLEMGHVGRLIGLDISDLALAAARVNTASWPPARAMHLVRGELCQLPFPDKVASLVISDPPWGESMGNRRDAKILCAPMLQEMNRVLADNGRIVIISPHQEQLQRAAQPFFTLERSLRVFQRGFHPYISVFRKRQVTPIP